MSKNKTLLAVIILLIFAIISLIIIYKNQKNIPSETIITDSQETKNNNTATNTPIVTKVISDTKKVTPDTNQYNMTEVAKHSTPADCWTAVNGKVYNLTQWINKHPGGSKAIIYMCGIDGSKGFNGQHGEQERPASELAGFQIGILK